MDNQIQKRYWDALRLAIEDYVAAVEKNENGYVIHGLARIVKLREAELDHIKGI